MKLARRVLISIAVTLVGLFVGVTWIAPCALSFYAAAKAPMVTRVVPTDLKDTSVSQARGQKLSYFGYEFEVPWGDLDAAQTQLYPKDKPHQNRAVLNFRSGLRLMVTAVPPREWINGISSEMKIAPQQLESAFGQDVTKSDYNFVKAMYEFTPAAMHHWNSSRVVYSREQMLLILKSLAPLNSAETGIFDVQNENFKGFQQGDTRASVKKIAISLYSDEGSIEFIFSRKDGQNPGITQPEINRIIQSLRKAVDDQPVVAATGSK